MKKIFLILIIIFANLVLEIIHAHGQSSATTCANAAPFCTGTTYTFPMATGITAEPGPNYGCLYTYPNPVWYYLKILNPGNIIIHIAGNSNTDSLDVDFVCWGPFTSPTGECDAGLTANCDWAGSDTAYNFCLNNTDSSSFYPSGNMVDCSYSANTSEDCHILNAQTGQYYILCITNYANMPGNLTFSQTGGIGTTDCGIIAPSINNNGPLCVGQTLQLTVLNPTSGAIYAWTGPNGFTSTIMNPTITNITAANAGVYSVVVTVNSDTSAPGTTTVVVNPNPVISITASVNPVCAGVSTTLTASGGIAYSWSSPLGIGNPVSAKPFNDTTYTVTGTDSNGCKDTSSIKIKINPNLIINISASANLICLGDSATLTASGGTSYLWSGGLGTTNPLTVAPTSVTTYTVTGTSAGCTGSTTVTINVNNLNVNTSSKNETCNKSDGVVMASATGGTGIYSYTWNTNPKQTSDSAIGLHAGTYYVTVTDGQCSKVRSVTLNNSPGPIAEFTVQPAVLTTMDGPASFYDNTIGNIISWQWNFGDGTTDGGSTVLHDYNNIGNYLVTLIVIDKNGCIDTVSEIVKVKDVFTFYIPNAFTPNDDKLNDGFAPQGINVDPNSFEMFIFNRWGNQVFYTNKWRGTESESWNGTLNNSGTIDNVIMDTYMYKIVVKEIGGPEHEYIGKISIIQ
jgi:gliding motility-associated-like protein